MKTKTKSFSEWAKNLNETMKKLSKKTGIPIDRLLLMMALWQLEEIHQHLEPIHETKQPMII